MSKPIFWFLLISVVFLSACRTLHLGKKTLKRISAKELSAGFQDGMPVFEWLDAKAKVTYTDQNDRSNTFSVNIRMKADSAIWLSASLMGIEGMRALITPDSVHVIDRLNKKYIRRDFAYLKETFALPDVNLETLQQILAGNKMFYNNNDIHADIDSVWYLLTSGFSYYINKTWLDPSDFTALRTHIQDIRHSQSMNIEFKEYKKVNDRPFAFERIIQLTRNNTPVTAKINYAKVSMEGPLDFPFNVPEKYENVY